MDLPSNVHWLSAERLMEMIMHNYGRVILVDRRYGGVTEMTAAPYRGSSFRQRQPGLSSIETSEAAFVEYNDIICHYPWVNITPVAVSSPQLMGGVVYIGSEGGTDSFWLNNNWGGAAEEAIEPERYFHYRWYLDHAGIALPTKPKTVQVSHPPRDSRLGKWLRRLRGMETALMVG